MIEILNFSVIVNPEKIGIQEFYMLTIELNLPNDPISRKLSENLAEKLSQDLKEVFFSAIAEDNTLRMVVSFFDSDHMNEFFSVLSTNEYVLNIEKVKLNFIPKGLRMFDFNEDRLMKIITSKYKEKMDENRNSEEDALGELISIESNSVESMPDLNRKGGKKDNDNLIPL